MMRQRSSRPLILLGLILMLALGIGCSQEVEAPTAVSEDTAAEVEVPAEVETVHAAAVAFIRESAAICVPQESVPWQVSTRDDLGLEGTAVYLFTAEDCALNVSYPEPASADTVYYVAYRNQTMDFCWQAFIDGNGDIQSTGYEDVEPDLANPAKVYCEDAGYTFELVTREDGQICPACVFSETEGDACNSWDFFYGNCGPQTAEE